MVMISNIRYFYIIIQSQIIILITFKYLFIIKINKFISGNREDMKKSLYKENK